MTLHNPGGSWRTLTYDYATRRCGVTGCGWTIRLPSERCAEHGGEPTDTLFTTDEFGTTVTFAEARSPFAEDAADDGDSTI